MNSLRWRSVSCQGVGHVVEGRRPARRSRRSGRCPACARRSSRRRRTGWPGPSPGWAGSGAWRSGSWPQRQISSTMMAEVMKNRPMKERHMLIRDRASITARTMPTVLAVLLGDGHRHHELPDVVCAARCCCGPGRSPCPRKRRPGSPGGTDTAWPPSRWSEVSRA